MFGQHPQQQAVEQAPPRRYDGSPQQIQPTFGHMQPDECVSNTSMHGTLPNQTQLEGAAKAHWTSKFNSVGSSPTSASIKNLSTAACKGSDENCHISICLECKDVVENIGLRNKAAESVKLHTNGDTVLSTSFAEHLEDESMLSEQLHSPLKYRETRQLHTQSLIIE